MIFSFITIIVIKIIIDREFKELEEEVEGIGHVRPLYRDKYKR